MCNVTFWLYIFCAFQRKNKVSCQVGVENANTKLYTSFWRTSQTIPTWPSKNLFHNSLFRMKRASKTSILSQNNKVCNGTNESVKIVISLHCVTFFHVECKQPTSVKIHKIFIAQKSYCACCVLNLVTIRSKYYFNFILNRTRSGREFFDHPSYIYSNIKANSSADEFWEKSQQSVFDLIGWL